MATLLEWCAEFEEKMKNTYFYKNSRIFKGYIPDPWDSWMGYKIKQGKMYKVA